MCKLWYIETNSGCGGVDDGMKCLFLCTCKLEDEKRMNKSREESNLKKTPGHEGARQRDLIISAFLRAKWKPNLMPKIEI